MLRWRAGLSIAVWAVRLGSRVSFTPATAACSAAVGITRVCRVQSIGAGVQRRRILLGSFSSSILMVANAGEAQPVMQKGLRDAPVPAPAGEQPGNDMVQTRQALMEAVARGRARKSVQVRELRSTSLEGALKQHDLQYLADEGPQGWVPLLVIAPETCSAPPGGRPAVVFLHPTGSSKEAMKPRMLQYAAAGYVTLAIDCRYHGDRCPTEGGEAPRSVYESALVRAWQEGVERPFLLDSVWDLLHLLDYIETREDVDRTRVGMTGVSFGGMHTWLCAALDTRVAVAAPVIGVQSFTWAVDHDKFQARVDSIPRVFHTASLQLGFEGHTNAQVVKAVWNRITPGLLDVYDAPFSLPCISPRPLLLVNGELDPRCPVEGWMERGVPQAESAYAAANAKENFKVIVVKGVGHQETEEMQVAVWEWLEKHLIGSR